jgi:hypothetical protein
MPQLLRKWIECFTWLLSMPDKAARNDGRCVIADEFGVAIGIEECEKPQISGDPVASPSGERRLAQGFGDAFARSIVNKANQDRHGAGRGDNVTPSGVSKFWPNWSVRSVLSLPRSRVLTTSRGVIHRTNTRLYSRRGRICQRHLRLGLQQLRSPVEVR